MVKAEPLAELGLPAFNKRPRTALSRGKQMFMRNMLSRERALGAPLPVHVKFLTSRF